MWNGEAVRVEKLVILGAGGHGRALIELIRDRGGLEIAGLVDARPQASAMLGVPVLGDESVLPGLRRAGVGLACIALGDPAARLAAALRLGALGFGFPALVHPTAVLAGSATVGEGSVVLPRAVLGAAPGSAASASSTPGRSWNTMWSWGRARIAARAACCRAASGWGPGR